MRISQIAFSILAASVCCVAYAEEFLSFENALERMVQNSPKYKATLESLEAEKAQLGAGLFAHFPTVSTGANYGASGAFENNSNVERSIGVNASLSLPLFQFGAANARCQSAQIGFKAVVHSERVALVETQKDMALLLVENLKSQKLVGLEERIFQSRVQFLEKSEALYKHGLLPAEELDKMRLNVGMARLQLNESKSKVLLSSGQVAVALNSSARVGEWGWSFPFFEKFENWDAAAALSQLLDKAVAGSTFDVQKSGHDIVVARSGLLPSFDLQLSVTKSFSLVADSTERPAGWQAGVGVSVPLFSRGENWARVEGAARNLRAAGFKVENAKRTVRETVFQLATSLKNGVVSSRERTLFVKQAQKNLERARERFLVGKISSNELAQDETKVFELEQDLVENTASLHKGYVQLCSTLVLSLFECEAAIF